MPTPTRPFFPCFDTLLQLFILKDLGGLPAAGEVPHLYPRSVATDEI